MDARIIATGEGWDFWRIGDDVYRTLSGSELDTYNLPMGRRWECTYESWCNWRNVFSWAKDVKP